MELQQNKRCKTGKPSVLSQQPLKWLLVRIEYTALSDCKNICLRKHKVSVKRISVCNVIENLTEHGIHCLPSSYNNDVINMLSKQVCCLRDVPEIAFCQGTKHTNL